MISFTMIMDLYFAFYSVDRAVDGNASKAGTPAATSAGEIQQS